MREQVLAGQRLARQPGFEQVDQVLARGRVGDNQVGVGEVFVEVGGKQQVVRVANVLDYGVQQVEAVELVFGENAGDALLDKLHHHSSMVNVFFCQACELHNQGSGIERKRC